MQKTPAAPQSPAPSGAGPVVAQSTPSLEAQMATLSGQLEALTAQRQALRSQLESMRLDNAGRATVQMREADVAMQIAQVRGDMARVAVQLREQGIGRARSFTVVPPAFPQRQFDPDVAAGLMFAFIFAVLMPLAIAVARRIWKGKPAQPAASVDHVIVPRLDHLEQAIDAIAIEVERVSEGQRFITKLFTERGGDVAKNGGMSPADKAQPALGAGSAPAERIKVAEKQPVR